MRRWLTIRTLYFLVTIAATITSHLSKGQCNTTLNKLLPARSVNNEDRFGSSLAANSQYMVVGAENSDTLGVLYGGAAFVYEKTVAGWAYRAMLTPSDPDEFDFFGNQVEIDESGNTIVVINRNYDQGGVYIYEKPADGWHSMTESYNIKLPEYTEFNSALDINDAGTTIAITNPDLAPYKFFVLQKPVQGWSAANISVVDLDAPNWSLRFGVDVLVEDEYIYLTSDNDETGHGIYIYHDDGSTIGLHAKLRTTLPTSSLAFFGGSLTKNGDWLAISGVEYSTPTPGQKFFLFKKNGDWSNAVETAKVAIPELEFSHKNPPPIQFVSPTAFAVGVLLKEGEYYTGKILQISATDPDWTGVTSETIYEEPFLYTPSEFANDMIWTGSDLVMSASISASVPNARFSVLSLTESGGLWGSEYHATLARRNASEVNFGTSIIKTGKEMVAGAPYDGTNGRGAGAIYVYDRIGDNFVKIHTILPSPRKIRSTGGSDAAFGHSIAVYENEMAVGAPSYRYANQLYGKVFLYKRTTGSWASATLYDSLTVPPELLLNHVGDAIVMNDHILATTAYNNFADEHTGALLIYEKVNNKWEFRQLLKLAKPVDKSWPSMRLSMHRNQIAVGSYASIGGGVSILEKNTSTGEWEAVASFGGEISTLFGGSPQLTENHLFVGAPGYSYDNVYKSGAVVVYTKLPGESWQSEQQPSAIIGAEQPMEGGYFGSSIDVIGNTLAVGAPGMFLTFDLNVRTIPGNSYVIQAHDYYWTNTTQVLNLQGERYAADERDHFGATITIDRDYFYIGARSENTEVGQFSGAVYYIPTPPVIFLYPPVCANADPFSLEAYPFGGTWSGPGITDDGKFDPQLAGAGKITLTYTTANCHYAGTVDIEVGGEGSISAISPLDVIKCSESEIQLSVESEDGNNFNWYYKPENSDTFVLLGTGGATYAVTNPGEYKAGGTGECFMESPIFRVAVENFPVSTGPQDVICSSAPVELVASREGTWEGIGVANNKFNPEGMVNGYHDLEFKVTTPTGCNLVLKDSVKINRVPAIDLNEDDSDFCETGAITLEAQPADPALTYTWFFSDAKTSPFSEIDQELNSSARVFKQGYYKVHAWNGECGNTSDTLTIGLDYGLPFEFVPGEPAVQVCNEKEFPLEVISREGTVYTWQFRDPEKSVYETLAEDDTREYIASKSGDYRVSGAYGFCSFTTEPIALEFISDGIEVPNVFTPNGDDTNPVFEIVTPFQISQLIIVNRDGRRIFSAATGLWDGGDSPSGVYFWQLQYKGCENKNKVIKGWVHLIR
jgi:hypothetical protein